MNLVNAWGTHLLIEGETLRAKIIWSIGVYQWLATCGERSAWFDSVEDAKRWCEVSV